MTARLTRGSGNRAGARGLRDRLSAPWRRSLPVRLALSVIAVAGFAVLAVAAVSYVRASTALRERINERIQSIADDKEQDLNEWMMSQQALLVYLAQSHQTVADVSVLMRSPDERLRSRSREEIRGELGRLRRGPMAAAEVQLIGIPGGPVLISTRPASEGRYVAEEQFYTEGKTRTFTQNIYPSPVDGQPTLTISTPIRAADGDSIAVLAAHLDLKKLYDLLKGQTGPVPVETYAVNRTGDIVTPEVFDRSAYVRGVHSFGIERALKGAHGAAEYLDYKGEPVLGVYRWLDKYEMALLVEVRRDDAMKSARSLLIFALLSSFIVLVTLSVGVVFATRRVTQPMLATAAAAERVAHGDFSVRAPEGTDDEIGQLARTFNSMTGKLQSLYGELNQQVASTHTALREAEANRALLQDIVDNASTMVCVVDLDGGLRLANRCFERTFNASQHTGADQPLRLADVVGAAAPDLLRVLGDARVAGRLVEREVVMHGRAEAHTWLVACFPLFDAAHAPYATGVIATDLTERARLEEERRQLDARTQHAQKLESLGIMAGGIAHDFNNILGAILGNADLAMATIDDRDEVQASLGQISSAARRAADLTRQMLAYAGKASFRRETINLSEIAVDIVSLVRVAQSKKVTFEVVVDAEPAWIDADPAQLSQVMLNLVTNAAESIGDAEGKVSVIIESDAPAPPDAPESPPSTVWRRLVVRDTGEGMSEATRARIFEPFFSTKESGHGLGLSAVTGIVRAAGGALRVESTINQGSVFEVSLPGVQVSERETASETLRAPRSATARQRGTVLIVDDEPSLRRVCAKSLAQVGYQVIEAADGLEAMIEFERHAASVDLIVLDLTMPGMNGAEVLLAVRQASHTVPVIVASGYDAADSAARLPFDARVRFLQKPFEMPALVQLVGELTMQG